MKLFQSIAVHRRYLLNAIGFRRFCTSKEAYDTRNYANNASEYNTVIGALTAQRRSYLLRDVYDDMLLDGVQPNRDIFYSLVVGTMKTSRLQDAFFFKDEMKAMGLLPDAVLYNYLISICGKCQKPDFALNILEEMKKTGVKPSGQTFICLLNACAVSGRLDQVYAIVRDMTAAGLGLNKFCYAGIIAAHKNKIPLSDDTSFKILELVEQSKGWSSIEASSESAENVMFSVSEEELYNLPTAEYVHRGGWFWMKDYTVYHVASHAFADFKDVKAMEKLMEMMKKDGKSPDIFMVIQILRCYLQSGMIDEGLKVLDEHASSGRTVGPELLVTLANGAMVGHSPRGMKIALKALTDLASRNYVFNFKQGTDLLLAAAGEEGGGYTVANYIWDCMQSRNIVPGFRAVDAYLKGLKQREVPSDDPRLMHVKRTWENMQGRAGFASS